MAGAVLIIVGLVVVAPVVILMGFSVLAVLLGAVLQQDSDASHTDDERAAIW